jgi:hypothetical protein
VWPVSITVKFSVLYWISRLGVGVTYICVDENVTHSMIYNTAACLLADYNWREVRCMQTAGEGFTVLGIRLSGNTLSVLFVNSSHSNRAEAEPNCSVRIPRT